MWPPSFKRGGKDQRWDAKVWMEVMEYFIIVKVVPANKYMLEMFDLMGDAKLWWK